MQQTKQINMKIIEAYPLKLPYPGAFHPKVEDRIREIVGTKFCIHLFSGSSKIGNIRVDINHKNATHNENVFDFIKHNSGAYPKPAILVLDPDYEIERKDRKLNGHGLTASISASVIHRNLIEKWIYANQFDEILYLDQCSPKFDGYDWDYWLVKTGGWHTNRVLNYYKKANHSLDCATLDRNCLT